MNTRSLLAVLFAGAAFLSNEAVATTAGMESMMSLKSMMKMKVKSKEQIMSDMTMDQALSMVMRMNLTEKDPRFVALLQKFVAGSQQQRTLRGAAEGSAEPAGYAAVQGTMELINGMMKEAQMKLDTSQINCERFERNQMVLLEETQADVASFNGLAAEARGGVLREQATIGMLTEKIPQVEYELGMHRRTCASEQAALNYQLKVISDDIEVVDGILESLGDMCPDKHPTTAPPEFLQLEESDTSHNLMKCAHCRADGMIMLQQDNIQPMLNKLKSETARGYVQKHLEMAYRQTQAAAQSVSQEQVNHQISLLQSKVHHHRRHKHHAREPEGDAGLHLTIEPVPPTPGDCVPTLKCTLKPSSCKRIYEKFELVKGGIEDKREELKVELRKLEGYCEETGISLMGQLSSMGTSLREAQTGLAMNTKSQIDAESSAAQKGRQHAELKLEYSTTLDECCAEQNTERSEMCALVKIRGEVTKLKGTLVFMTDCEVGPWVDDECTASCGGGIRKKNREILVHPIYGMPCPPLSMEEECNTQACPVDCVLNDWSGWSACSAGCGGGVTERARGVRVPAQNGGAPCDETEEELVCNIQACDRDCILSGWSGWSTCNAACDGGHQSHSRGIAEPALGTGTCPAPTDPERLGFARCNTMPCSMLLPRGGDRTLLQCNSKADVVIVMDSSGSLGPTGWEKVKALTKKLVESFNALNTDAENPITKVAVLVYSSWNTRFVTHLTTGTTVADVDGIQWIAWGTLTAEALGMAEEEFLYGRDDASSATIVITDGQPYSADQTKQAAEKLKEKSRVLWIPVGWGAPVDLIREMASEPQDNHVVYVQEFSQLDADNVVNKVVANTCPMVK